MTVDESLRRLRRSEKYLGMWAIGADTSAVPVITADRVGLPDVGDVHGRLLALVLLGLKGQGLGQVEVFAFADAYDVWPALDAAEHDFVLDDAAQQHDLVQAAWRFDAAWVLLWALGLVNHLVFPDRPCDPARVVEASLTGIAAVSAGSRPGLRPLGELLDSADVALRLRAVSDAAREAGLAMPSGLDPGVVHERAAAFAWLLRVRQ